jgi:hypothetical protein
MKVIARESAALEYKEMHVFALEHIIFEEILLLKSTMGMTKFVPSYKSLLTPSKLIGM